MANVANRLPESAPATQGALEENQRQLGREAEERQALEEELARLHERRRDAVPAPHCCPVFSSPLAKEADEMLKNKLRFEIFAFGVDLVKCFPTST